MYIIHVVLLIFMVLLLLLLLLLLFYSFLRTVLHLIRLVVSLLFVASILWSKTVLYR